VEHRFLILNFFFFHIFYRTVIPTLALDTSGGDHISNGSSTGSIVGGVVGGAAGVALIVAGIVLLKRRNRKKAFSREQQERQLYDDEFYSNPYRQNDQWNGEFNMSGGGFPGTGEHMNPTRGMDDDDEDFYRSKQNRRSWWSSVSSVFRK
jgi:hypothetical protein